MLPRNDEVVRTHATMNSSDAKALDTFMEANSHLAAGSNGTVVRVSARACGIYRFWATVRTPAVMRLDAVRVQTMGIASWTMMSCGRTG